MVGGSHNTHTHTHTHTHTKMRDLVSHVNGPFLGTGSVMTV